MSDELLRAIRLLVIPIGALIFFLVIIPKACIRHAPAAVPAAATDATPPVTTSSAGGLQISGGNSSNQPVASASSLPPGLDAERIQYLVEINSLFSEPVTARIPKKYGSYDPTVKALQDMKYIEVAADGLVTITTDGALNLDLHDQGDAWTVTLAKRVFDKVNFVSRIEDDKYDVTFTWRFAATPVGTKLRVDEKKLHNATARFVGGPGNWALSEWTAAPSDQR